MAETTVVEIPTTAAIEEVQTAVVVAQASEAAAEGAAVVAESAAQEIVAQLEEDEEWLEKRLTEIRTEISLLKNQSLEAMAPLLTALQSQSQIIAEMNQRILTLSTPVTSSATTIIPSEPIVAVEESVAVPEVVAENQPTELAPRKKHRRI